VTGVKLHLPLPRSVGRALSRHRRLVSALLVGTGVLATVGALAPPPPLTTTVVVAARDVAGGQRLTNDDVTMAALPLSAVPDRAVVESSRVVGRIAVAGMTRHQVLTEPSVVTGTGQAQGGTVIMPMTLTDTAVLSVLRPGDLIDVVSVNGQTGKAVMVVSGARVVATPPQESGGFGGVSSTGWVLIQVPDTSTTAVVEAMSSGRLTVALH
jgi:pilus assembly protein CpaB